MRVTAPDSAAIAATVESFHAALAAGDSVAALSLLAGDAIILESGDLETREQYAAHHLAADIAFARALPGVRELTVLSQQGDVAWVSSTSTARGTYRDRELASQGAELMVLIRTNGSWRICAIHWSSRKL